MKSGRQALDLLTARPVSTLGRVEMQRLRALALFQGPAKKLPWVKATAPSLLRSKQTPQSAANSTQTVQCSGG